MSSALDIQIGGDHYNSAYQPIELMENVRMFATCSFILKYIYRHKNKGKKQDLEKALHCCALMKQISTNWYYGTSIGIGEIDCSNREFHKFILANKQLDANQIRAIIAISEKDMEALEAAINDEILACYNQDSQSID